MNTPSAPTEEQITARAYELMAADVHRPSKEGEKRQPLSWSAAQAHALAELSTPPPAPAPANVVKLPAPASKPAASPAS